MWNVLLAGAINAHKGGFSLVILQQQLLSHYGNSPENTRPICSTRNFKKLACTREHKNIYVQSHAHSMFGDLGDSLTLLTHLSQPIHETIQSVI